MVAGNLLEVQIFYLFHGFQGFFCIKGELRIGFREPSVLDGQGVAGQQKLLFFKKKGDVPRSMPGGLNDLHAAADIVHVLNDVIDRAVFHRLQVAGEPFAEFLFFPREGFVVLQGLEQPQRLFLSRNVVRFLRAREYPDLRVSPLEFRQRTDVVVVMVGQDDGGYVRNGAAEFRQALFYVVRLVRVACVKEDDAAFIPDGGRMDLNPYPEK